MVVESEKFWEGDEWVERFRQEKKRTKIIWLSVVLILAFYLAMLISIYFGEAGMMVLLFLLTIAYFAYKKYFTAWVAKKAENKDMEILNAFSEEKNVKELFWILVNSKTKTGTEHAIKALVSLDVSEEEIYNSLEELTAYNLNTTELFKVLGALSIVDHPEIIDLMQTLIKIYPTQLIWIYRLQKKKLQNLGYADYQEYKLKNSGTEEE